MANIPALGQGVALTGASATAWAEAILAEIGAPITGANVSSLTDWFNREGGGGANNPLNTTLPAAGSAGAINSVGVQNYSSPAAGLAATVATLRQYPAITSALKSGKGLINNPSVASELSEWSGGGYTSISGAALDPGVGQFKAGKPVSGGGSDESIFGLITRIGESVGGLITKPVSVATGVSSIAHDFGLVTTTLNTMLTDALWLFKPSHWIRIMAFGFGILFLLPGIWMLSKAGSGEGDISLALGILLVMVASMLLWVAFHNLPDNVTSISELMGHLSDTIRSNSPATTH